MQWLRELWWDIRIWLKDWGLPALLCLAGNCLLCWVVYTLSVQIGDSIRQFADDIHVIAEDIRNR
jgi:hypothetical protein